MCWGGAGSPPPAPPGTPQVRPCCLSEELGEFFRMWSLSKTKGSQLGLWHQTKQTLSLSTGGCDSGEGQGRANVICVWGRNGLSAKSGSETPRPRACLAWGSAAPGSALPGSLGAGRGLQQAVLHPAPRLLSNLITRQPPTTTPPDAQDPSSEGGVQNCSVEVSILEWVSESPRACREYRLWGQPRPANLTSLGGLWVPSARFPWRRGAQPHPRTKTGAMTSDAPSAPRNAGWLPICC